MRGLTPAEHANAVKSRGNFMGEFYEEATHGLSASHLLQAKANPSFLAMLSVHQITSPSASRQNSPQRKTELSYTSQLGQLLRELRPGATQQLWTPGLGDRPVSYRLRYKWALLQSFFKV